MINVKEDDQLLSELEELYLLSKHWLSDLEFLKRNLEFLQKLYGKAFFQLIQKKDPEMITEILSNVSNIKKDRIRLKDEIAAYLHSLEPLIKDPAHSFGISIVMVHADLEQRLTRIFEDYKFVKKIVSNFAKWSLKGEKVNIALLNQHMAAKPEFQLLAPLFSSMDEPDMTEEELEHFCYDTEDTRD